MSDQHLAQEAQDIAAGARVREFLDDPAVQDFLRKYEKVCFAEFVSADTPEKRHDAWAKASALSAFNAGIRAIEDRGKQAVHQRSTREAADRQRSASPRK